MSRSPAPVKEVRRVAEITKPGGGFDWWWIIIIVIVVVVVLCFFCFPIFGA